MRVRVDHLRKHLRLPADASRDVIARALAQPRVSIEAEHRAFMRARFPGVNAARYAIPGGILGDPTPLSDSPGATPATNPPTGDVHRSPQLPASHAPAAYVGPATPPATPSTSTTPIGSPPAAVTPEQQRARRLGYPLTPAPAPFDITARQGPGQIDYTRA